VASFWKIKKILALPRNSRMELRVSRQTMEAGMTYPDPDTPRPQRPPDVDPLPPMTPGSRYGDVDERTWNTGVILATILAALVVIGAIVWAATSDQETASNRPAQTTGQGNK
jgi:hypothetical protein